METSAKYFGLAVAP